MEPHASSEDQKHPFRAGEWRHRQQKPSGAFLLTAAEWPADPQKEQQPRHRLSDSENGQKRFFHAARQKVEENADQLLGGDGAAVGGKTDFHVENQTAVCCIENTGGALENLLTAAAYAKQSAFAGSLCTEGIRCDCACKLAQQVILKSDALLVRVVQGRGNAAVFPVTWMLTRDGAAKGSPWTWSMERI